MRCPLCKTDQIQIYDVVYPFFRHLDFQTLATNGRMAQCRRCSLIHHPANPDEAGALAAGFKSATYAQSAQTSHTIWTRAFPEPKTRSFLQAEILCRHIDPKDLKVLDIGCFNGELLRELAVRIPGGVFHGLDVNPYLASFFEKDRHLKFRCTRLQDLEDTYDLICLSHSLGYLQELSEVAQAIEDHLNPGGLVFVQTPDIAQNPLALLLGDQFHHFTPGTFSRAFRFMGFEMQLLPNAWFPREIMALGQATPDAEDPGKAAFCRELAACLDTIGELVARVSAYKAEHGVAVLGTTINAGVADCILDSATLFFVDENPHKVDRKFRGKPVVHPRDIQTDIPVLVPYGQSAGRLTERMQRLYKGHYIAL